MQKKDQVFLYIKDEIEKISSAEEKEILDEAKAIEHRCGSCAHRKARCNPCSPAPWPADSGS